MIKLSELKVVRCKKCNRLLGKVKGEAEIKCSRCHTTNNFKQ
ncbi:Com family DNA-binding transcriptional regulator [Lysinibacillus sp. NPDC096418]